MISDFYQLLAERIDPALIATPTMEQQHEAANDLKAKEQIALLSGSRANERRWKNNQKRSAMSKTSLLLDRKPDLTKPDTVINTALNNQKIEKSLLGSNK